MAKIRLGDFKSAAGILIDNLGDPTLKPTAKIDLMEWIADCHSKAEDEVEAAKWFERAGKSWLESKDLSALERRTKALSDFSRAVEASKRGNDLEGIRRATRLKTSLNPN